MNFNESDKAVPLAVDIEVVIDSSGVPDMSTFKATGPAATENQFALSQWVKSSTFKPARRNGQPVSGVYHLHTTFRIVGPP
jgi:hypothetical protein